jgi:hypothetical protein
MRPRTVFARVAITIFAIVGSAPATTITIINGDQPNVGFNDPTPAAPVGGNPGTTVGQQRFNAVQHAADIWAAALNSQVEIRAEALWAPLQCAPTSGFLGFAGPVATDSDFPGAEHAATWYPIALANKLARTDLDPAADDIYVRLNSDVGTAGCLTNFTWYYGLDNNAGATEFDLVTTTLHELAHGLGSLEFVDDATGGLPGGQIDVYSRLILDNTTGKRWGEMNDAERAVSAINTGNVVWDGSRVTAAAPSFLGDRPILTVNTPPTIDGVYRIGTASFGPQLSSPGVTGDVVLVDDGVGVTSDACDSILNAGALLGNIALIDRGNCTFVFKVKAAQDAGAIAAVIVNNVPGTSVTSMGGSDPTITIPAVMVSFRDGDIIKGALASGVNVTLHVDPSHLAGADDSNKVLLFAPNPNQPGSSISHWDLSTSPDLLMEPNIPSNIPLTGDLTIELFKDIGWFPTTDPVYVENLSATAAAEGLQLSWELAREALHELAGIAVQRATAFVGPYTNRTAAILAPTRSMTYLDKDVQEETTYWYRLLLFRSDGGSDVSPAIRVAFTNAPIALALETPYESMEGIVHVKYSLARSATPVELQIYSVAGRRIRSLDLGVRERGVHHATWDRLDASGQRVAPGVYLVRLCAGAAAPARKMALLR